MNITRDLKVDIESNQNQLRNAIYNHQELVIQMKQFPENPNLLKKIVQAERKIILIGLEQKPILDRLRQEYYVHKKCVRYGVAKNGVDERKFNLSQFFNSTIHPRKQNIVVRASPAGSFSEDSTEGGSPRSTPDHHNPVEPHDLTQEKFLAYFGLVTHEVYKEMQNKRAERKRRSTANPHFLYGNRGWDFSGKRTKRGNYLISNISPPNTRQAVRRRNERTSPPTITNGNGVEKFVQFPSIPHLPKGLTIERIDSVPCPNPEKVAEKQQLQEKRESLTSELTQLQDRHSQLTISLKNQKSQQEEMLKSQQSTEEKITQILSFIQVFKKPQPVLQ